MSKIMSSIDNNDALTVFLSTPKSIPKMAMPRVVVVPSSAKKPSLVNIFAHVRADGLEYRNIPSLMGNTRKLPSGEVIE